MKHFKPALFFLLMPCSLILNAQEDVPNRIPEYLFYVEIIDTQLKTDLI